MKDSADRAMRLRSRKFPTDNVFYKIDIKDSYMSEEHVDIAVSSADVIHPPRGAI